MFCSISAVKINCWMWIRKIRRSPGADKAFRISSRLATPCTVGSKGRSKRGAADLGSIGDADFVEVLKCCTTCSSSSRATTTTTSCFHRELHSSEPRSTHKQESGRATSTTFCPLFIETERGAGDTQVLAR
ncbi:hypothetical protein MPTK1_6g21100 [Marchantia polymorpha subsp. ruderalis]|uniref:Uncharacterized protein n=2 Tax=Marchantia polymorpha TaxID=3197 RepID=A0AAF6BUE4_MARPO|nr:hypothetical protein MARPO_0091s0045 [Marchantia polymorpha]BBN15628.1 hypothetical protein Mp_6g21100 [Marchantia polymorpha subsp. ruderalis]|eukprot:PTQ33186.1 hypothetical protein MARPO_0091s0045 [Marchantia polymorpha]